MLDYQAITYCYLQVYKFTKKILSFNIIIINFLIFITMNFSEIQTRNAHIRAIADLFGGFKKETSLDTVWHSWRVWECKIHRLSEWYCDNEYLYKRAERELDKIEKELPAKLAKLFNNPELFIKYFYINTDPRGYSLKLKVENPDEVSRDIHRDWGSFLIMAPDSFTY